jgi:Regulatory CLIP domain of proteinases
VSVFLTELFGHDFAERYDLGEGTECNTPLGVPGVCVNLRACPELLNHLSLSRMRRPQGAMSADLLRRSLCSFRGSDPIVCCSGRVSGGGGSANQQPKPAATPAPNPKLVVWTPNAPKNFSTGSVCGFAYI